MAAKKKHTYKAVENSLAANLRLDGRVAIITGGGGMLGRQHAKVIHEFGGIPIIVDIHQASARAAAKDVGERAVALTLDITQPDKVRQAARRIQRRFGRVDILINNAARNPKVELGTLGAGRLEDFDLNAWNADLAVGLTGAVICSRYFGELMADAGHGVILNISSDLGLIGPNQTLYEQPDRPPHEQDKKPVSYSVVKSGLLGLTRYLATYWADRGVRTNAICPGGVAENPPAEFLAKITKLIPMQRMARKDDYQGMVLLMCSDAGAYMNGSVVSVDGGRTCW